MYIVYVCINFCQLFVGLYVCEVCSKVYTKSSSLYMHNRYFCNPHKKYHNCPVEECNYKSPLKSNLKRHMFAHHRNYNVIELFTRI